MLLTENKQLLDVPVAALFMQRRIKDQTQNKNNYTFVNQA